MNSSKNAAHLQDPSFIAYGSPIKPWTEYKYRVFDDGLCQAFEGIALCLKDPGSILFYLMI